MTDTPGQTKPARVAAAPKQAGETTQRKLALSLGSSAVWTERMLDTLERGIEGGQWYSLIDKVWNQKHLLMAAWSVIRKDGAPGVDGQSCARLEAHLDETVRELARLLQAERYEPQPVKRVWIDKLGSNEKRPLGIPTVRDRVVQTALAYVLEPIFERDFAEHSYGFRPGRNAQQAIARVETLLAQGQVWVVDADLKGYLDRASYYTSVHGVVGKSCGCWSNACIRRPFCRPRETWTIESSPRFTRCMIVCRDTPRMRMASGIAT